MTTLVAGLDEFQGIHRARVLEPGLQGVDDRIGTVTDPLLAKSLPDNVGGEDGPDGLPVAPTERPEEVDDHDLEVVQAGGRH